MLCEECNQNQATVVIAVIAGQEITKRHLCSECTKKMEKSFTQGDMQSFLSSILSLLSAKPKGPSRVCSQCGLRYDDFQQTGKLGCANCYYDFTEELRPLLLQIHGRNQHAGRLPSNQAPSSKLQQIIHVLRERMEQAVCDENFEEAAKFRDEIRALMKEQETEAQV